MDLLVGCGLGYLLFIPVLVYLAQTTGTTQWPEILVAGMLLFANSPHYGATLVRVYDAREDRRKYAVFAVWVTLALALLLVASTHSIWLSSLLITVYLTWSPWHFSGQNYGLVLMFLRRRGIDVDSTTKRLIYGSFVLSAALAIIAIHTGRDDLVFAPQTLHVANAPTVLSLRLPSAMTQLVVPLGGLAYLGCLLGAGWRLRRRAGFPRLAPALVLVASQALWFVVPALALDWTRARNTTLIFAAIWVSTAHSLQYLWVTAYYARASASGTSVRTFLWKSFLAGTALTTLPGVLLAPQLLGGVPWDAGLAAVIFAMVNIHHFILDGAIWKLRDGRVARVLLRAQDPVRLPEPIGAPRRRPWLRRSVWALAGLAVLLQGLSVHAELELRRGEGRDRIERAMRFLRSIGRERVETQFAIGRHLAAHGDHARAIEHFLRSIELFPTGRVWGALGVEHRALGRWDLALAAFNAAIELNPDFSGAHHQRAEMLLVLDPSRADPNTRPLAIASLERALELSPGFAEAALLLARLKVESGQRDAAIQVLERASTQADPAKAELVRLRLAELRER